MSKKLTLWFPGDVKPARPGVYQVMDGGPAVVCYSRWTGHRWMFRNHVIEFAGVADRASYTQEAIWRGLAKKP